MLNRLGLGFVFNAHDLASGVFGRLERNFMSLDKKIGLGTDRIQSSFRQLAGGMGLLVSGGAMVAGGFALANAAGKFEQGLAAVGTVTQATTDQMARLRDAALDAGMSTKFSPDEAVDGLLELSTAGQTAEQSVKTLLPVLDLATGSLGQLNVAGSAAAVVGTLNAYGMAADEAAGVTDKLLKATLLTNFQAKDFEYGLSKAAAAGAVFGQSLDDVLISMGLLRNRNIDASSSATAFREATRRVGAEERARNAVLETGVEVFDRQANAMRPILDIMVDFVAATEGMTAAERLNRVVRAFGTRGLLLFNSVLGASFTTMRDGVDVTLKGADAILALRNEMQGASGTAQQFRERLLDTFEGQKTLLRGVTQTLAVVMGEPFAAVFKPVVGAVVRIFEGLVGVIRSIPAPVKKVLAAFTTVAGGVLMFVGGIIAAKASFALFVLGMKVLGVTIGGILAVLLPAIAAVAALSLAVGGLYYAFRNNLGGIADFAHHAWDQISLFFRGLKQLVTEGGLFGEVREELNRTENEGLKSFLVTSWMVLYRLQRIWEGIKGGFTAAMDAAGPVFQALTEALSGFGAEVGSLFSTLTGGAAGLPSDRFKNFGVVVGFTIGRAIELLAALLASAFRLAEGVVWAFREIYATVQPVLELVGHSLREVFVAWNELVGSTDRSTSALQGDLWAWMQLGRVIGAIIGFIATGVSTVFAALFYRLSMSLRMLKAVKDAVGSILPSSWFKSEKRPSEGASVDESPLMTPIEGAGDPLATMSAAPLSASMPAAAESRSAASELARLETILSQVSRQKPAPSQPLVIHMQVDGETIARAVHRADRDSSARAFTPLPVY